MNYKSFIKVLLKVICFSTILLGNIIYGQEVNQDDFFNHKLVILSKVKKENKILLRWGVTSPLGWRRLNKYGYRLKRYTIVKNGSVLKAPIEKDLGVFKPQALNFWESIIEENDNAGIMAQSLYGESFSVQGESNLSTIINLSEEQQQRYTWAFYVADQDFEVAQMAGLGYVDTDVLANEMYAYKIFSLVPEEDILIEEGITYTGLQDYEDLPVPQDLAVIFKENLAMLSWNYEINKETYNSYFVERSEDGVTYRTLNEQPLTSLNNGPQKNPKRMFYLDSIKANIKYYYRIKGRTQFGEFGPISEVVSGIGRKVLAYVPRIKTKKYLNEKSIIIGWEFLEEGNEQIKGFQLSRSDKADGTYKIVQDNILPTARKVQYNSLQPTNYMTITAIGKEGANRTSLPALIQPVDSVPPLKPIQFKGKVDSLGIVTLEWKANKEKDMLGYRVFRGNNKDEEYSQITISPHQGTKYYDSISVKNLNSRVFYKLIAVDERFNMSEPSDILELKKPDFIKPTQPVFKSYNIKEGKVYLTWANSSSDDVVKHEVYRKEKNSTNWQLIHTVNNDLLLSKSENKEHLISKWEDENVTEAKQYYYTVIAIDASKLESDPAPPLTLTIPKTTLAPAIKRLGSYVDKPNKYIELFWKRYEKKDAMKIAVYKGLKDKPISLLKNVLPNTKRIIDANIKPNNEYVYMLRVFFKDGSVSEIARLNVKF